MYKKIDSLKLDPIEEVGNFIFYRDQFLIPLQCDHMLNDSELHFVAQDKTRVVAKAHCCSFITI